MLIKVHVHVQNIILVFNPFAIVTHNVISLSNIEDLGLMLIFTLNDGL